ncbi:MAG: hypothetical protein HN341_15260 [Verrucomicrobia bacterium]|jgi:Ca2+-binding EF-hand superfamily protein|nr:hypothetical protein [Verrucomicrobiota bacterium]
MNRLAKLATVVVLGVAATGTLVLAESDGCQPRGRRMREQGDQGQRHQRMREADTNDDKKVSFEEFKAARMQHMQEKFQQLDRNGDGFLSREDRPEGGRERGGSEDGDRPERGGRGRRGESEAAE